jgi:hypothetical protein
MESKYKYNYKTKRKVQICSSFIESGIACALESRMINKYLCWKLLGIEMCCWRCVRKADEDEAMDEIIREKFEVEKQ